MSDRIVSVTAAELIWRFSDQPGDEYPSARTGTGYSNTKVDPFPCYPHDLEVVADTLAWVESTVSVKHKPTVYVLDREPLSRTNGWATVDYNYDRDADAEGPQWDGVIVLAGKRIPPHPAVTRYLVAHEYGHHVEFDLLRQRGLDPGDSVVRNEYAAVRGITEPAYYGGGTWHASPGELLANDFRILVADVEPSYWPHPGFPHPQDDEMQAIRDWWTEQLS